MADLNNFNANEVEPETRPQPIPQGDYVMAIAGTEMKKTSKGNGEYLKVELQVLEGQFKGRKVFDQLVLKHANPETVRIARGRLSSICRAVGVMTPKDSVQLHGLPMKVSVGLEKRKDNGELKNVVKAYAKKGAAAQPAAAIPSNNGTAPWKK